MAKGKRLFFFLIVFSSAIVHGFEKLPPSYHITYGNPEAPIKVVEYFSFTCPKCLKLIREDFEALKEKYINVGKVYWIFHPYSADRLTLQAMVCLDKLNEAKKRLFFEVISKNLEGKGFDLGCVMMQAAMEHFQQSLPALDKMSFLEGTEEFRRAFAFLKQKDCITSVPTVEINGISRDEFPARKFLEKQFTILLANEGTCK